MPESVSSDLSDENKRSTELNFDKNFNNPFAPQFEWSNPTGETFFVLTFEQKSSFSSDDEYFAYGRSKLVNFVRDWLHPRLHIWTQRIQKLNLTRRILTDVVIHVLENITTVIQKIVDVLFGCDLLAFRWGRAFGLELHQRIFQHETKLQLHKLITRMLTFILEIHRQVHKRKLETQKRTRDHQAADSLKNYITFFKKINEEYYVLHGLTHIPAFAVAGKEISSIIQKRCSDCTDKLIWVKVDKDIAVLEEFTSTFSSLRDRGSNLPPPIDLHKVLEEGVINHFTTRIYEITISKATRTDKCLEMLRSFLLNRDHYGRERLVATLVNEVNAKLLNVGVCTGIILHAYAFLVESLHILDPSDVLMHRVCRVIKEYIKRRSDTVRQIITYITTERRNDLNTHMNNAARHSTIVDEEDSMEINDEMIRAVQMEVKGWHEWQPNPPDADPRKPDVNRETADVFTMLVSVYGSKDMFVKEYRQLLAERLSCVTTKDPVFERRYLDLLKQRFTEGELQHCDVMLRDVNDSDAVVQMSRFRAPLVSAQIVSSHFWPNFDKEGVESFPSPVEEQMIEVDKAFSNYKKGRELQWHRISGYTEMTLTVEGVSVTKMVPNAMAAVLYKFCEKEEWEVNELAPAIPLETSIAKKRLEWWCSQGVLTCCLPSGAVAEVYRLTKTPSNIEKYKGVDEAELEEEEGAGIETTQDAVDSLEQYWRYTRQYITNQENGEIKADRILNIYKMFSSPSSQQLSLEIVVAFLAKKVKVGLLSLSNGMYRVVNDAPNSMSKMMADGESIDYGDAAKYVNDPSIEYAWAVRTYERASIHMNLLISTTPSHLKLNKHHQSIYDTFRRYFPDLGVEKVTEDELKGDLKPKWREYCEEFKDIVDDYNMGCLLRIEATKCYCDENTLIVPRVIHLAVETARNIEGVNDRCKEAFTADQKANEEKEKQEEADEDEAERHRVMEAQAQAAVQQVMEQLGESKEDTEDAQ